MLTHLKRNWRKYLAAGLIAGATYYGGPMAGQVLRERVLPKIGIGSAEGAEVMPVPPPGTPVITKGSFPCEQSTLIITIYDTDPSGPNAMVTYRVGDQVFLVLSGVPQDFEAWLALPGREVQKLTRACLLALYSHPCEIVKQIVGAPT